jgi:hypothetical protein
MIIGHTNIKNEKIRLLIEFYKDKGRIPNRDEFIETQDLKFDAGAQYQNFKRGHVKIDDEQRQKLIDNIPDFSVENKTIHERDSKINVLIDFIQTKNRIPKLNDIISLSGASFNVYNFYNYIRYHQGRLTNEQIEFLNERIPGWNVVNKKTSSRKRVHIEFLQNDDENQFSETN